MSSKWKFYVSGICFGKIEVEDQGIFHQPYDVYTGTFQEKQVLDSGFTLYQEMGKMNVLEALEQLAEYEAGVAEGKDKFTTESGQIYTKRCDGEYVQRIVKFPKDLVTDGGKVVAVITPWRDQCAILVKEGFEDRTILKTWKEKYQAPLWNIRPKETYMVAMRDGVRLATDVYLPDCEGKVPTVLIRTIIPGKKLF